MDLQRDAADAIKSAENDLEQAKKQLEAHGLGTAFKIPSLIAKLQQAGIGLDKITSKARSRKDVFPLSLYLATIHVLRDLKHRARIPVPGSVTLVGVADEWGLLREGQIYACSARQGKEPEWIRGPVCISRSPTVHLGDVRMVMGESLLHYSSSEVDTYIFSVSSDRSTSNRLQAQGCRREGSKLRRLLC